MGLLDMINSDRERQLASTIEMLTVTVQQQSEVIMALVKTVAENRETIQKLVNEMPEHREAIGELGGITTFIIQQQNEIAQHIMLTENVRKGKLVPGMAGLKTDDDLIN